MITAKIFSLCQCFLLYQIILFFETAFVKTVVGMTKDEFCAKTYIFLKTFVFFYCIYKDIMLYSLL